MGSYLDYQSAKPVDPRVIEAMMPYFQERFGNPSSLHGEGDEATKVLEECRKTIAGFINAEPDEIIFTSGATESNNLALIGYALRNRDKGDHIIISEVEHISIHNIAKYLEKNGFKVSRLPVDQYGKIAVQKLASRITPQTILISIGYASNEIGTIQPIAEVGALAREKGIAFHSDAVAAEGLVPLDVKRDRIDLLT
jgi:cysteine desulfurase